MIYDLPGRDCAALASNGEIPATAAGLTEYETQYINPIVSILRQFASSPIRVVAIIEPDSLPNVVTNQSVATCQTSTPFYESVIAYAGCCTRSRTCTPTWTSRTERDTAGRAT